MRRPGSWPKTWGASSGGFQFTHGLLAKLRGSGAGAGAIRLSPRSRPPPRPCCWRLPSVQRWLHVASRPAAKPRQRSISTPWLPKPGRSGSTDSSRKCWSRRIPRRKGTTSGWWTCWPRQPNGPGSISPRSPTSSRRCCRPSARRITRSRSTNLPNLCCARRSSFTPAPREKARGRMRVARLTWATCSTGRATMRRRSPTCTRPSPGCAGSGQHPAARRIRRAHRAPSLRGAPRRLHARGHALQRLEAG